MILLLVIQWSHNKYYNCNIFLVQWNKYYNCNIYSNEAIINITIVIIWTPSTPKLEFLWRHHIGRLTTNLHCTKGNKAGNTKGGSITVPLTSCLTGLDSAVWLTTDNFCFYLQNRLIQTSQTGGQRYSDTFPFSIPWIRWSMLSTGLHHPLDGVTNPQYKLLHFIQLTFFCKKKRALAFNRDRCWHLMLCLRLILFH